MNLGDKVKVDGREGVVRVAEPLNGEIVVELVDAGGAPYYANVAVDKLDPVRPTWRATHPELGNVTVELPVEGNPEVRARWSDAAVGRITG